MGQALFLPWMVQCSRGGHQGLRVQGKTEGAEKTRVTKWWRRRERKRSRTGRRRKGEGEELQAVATRPAPPCPDRWSHGFGLRCSPVGPRGPEPAAVSAAGGAAQGERALAARPGLGRAARGQAGAPAGLGGAAVPAGPGLPSPALPAKETPCGGRCALAVGGEAGRHYPAAWPGASEPRSSGGAAAAQVTLAEGPGGTSAPARACPSTSTLGTLDPTTAMMGASEQQVARAEPIGPAHCQWGAQNLSHPCGNHKTLTSHSSVRVPPRVPAH